MIMTSQAYPLELTTENDERLLVIGWSYDTDSAHGPQPVAVSLDGPAGSAVVVNGLVQYRRPDGAGAPRRGR